MMWHACTGVDCVVIACVEQFILYACATDATAALDFIAACVRHPRVWRRLAAPQRGLEEGSALTIDFTPQESAAVAVYIALEMVCAPWCVGHTICAKRGWFCLSKKYNGRRTSIFHFIVVAGSRRWAR